MVNFLDCCGAMSSFILPDAMGETCWRKEGMREGGSTFRVTLLLKGVLRSLLIYRSAAGYARFLHVFRGKHDAGMVSGVRSL